MSSVPGKAGHDEPGSEPETSTGRRGGDRWPFSSAVVVLVVGLLVTAGLTWVSADLHSSEETRLLKLRARDVAAVLTSALPSVQTPLASGAALADATRGEASKFRQFITPYVGTGPGHPFVSVSLWRLSNTRRPILVVGSAPALASSPARARTVLAGAATRSGLSVIGLLGQDGLGFAFAANHGSFAAYG